MKRVYAYFDGSNFYHYLKNSYGTHKIDFHKLSKNMLKEDEMLSYLKYFNSPVLQQKNNAKFISQSRFISRLKSLENTEVILGNLVKRRLGDIHLDCQKCGHVIADSVNCPICGSNIIVKSIEKITEKGVDVSIATNILLDAIEDKYDSALLFSGDADFSPTIKYVVNNLKKSVIYCSFPTAKTYQLKQTCSEERMIQRDTVDRSSLVIPK